MRSAIDNRPPGLNGRQHKPPRPPRGPRRPPGLRKAKPRESTLGLTFTVWGAAWLPLQADPVRQRRAAKRPRLPLLLGDEAAARFVGCGPRTWRAMNAAALVPAAIRVQGLGRRWSRDELAAWCAAGCPPRARWQEIRRSTA